MAEPRVRACDPPRMAVLVDGETYPLPAGSAAGTRFDMVSEYRGVDRAWHIAIKHGTASGTPTTPAVPDAYRRIAVVIVGRHATAIHPDDIQLCPAELLPLDDDWVSPTGEAGDLPAPVARPYGVPEPGPVVTGSAVERASSPSTSWALGWLSQAFTRTFGGRA